MTRRRSTLYEPAANGGVNEIPGITQSSATSSATAHTVRYTATTALLVPACYDAEAEATLRFEQGPLPSLSLSVTPSLLFPRRLFASPSTPLSTDSFSSSTRHSPRASSAPIATTTITITTITTTTGPRHGLSLSVSTDELYRSTSF